MKKIEIEITENTSSDIADVICFLRGFIEGKADDWEGKWIESSLNTLCDVNRQIKVEELD